MNPEPSSILVSVLKLDRRRNIMVSLQVLPFASDETLKVLEENLSSLPAITDLLHMGFSAGQLTNAILGTQI